MSAEAHKIIESDCNKMLELGVIRPSMSPWSSPVVLVTKKNGDVRFCVDYRRLNALTIKDSYPLPNICDRLGALGECRYFCTMDLASRFWQIPMDKKDKCKTSVDPDKIRVVTERREPANLEELRFFLGMTGYYRGHIKDYAHMASPLHALTKKNVPWKWGPEEVKGYHRFLTALVGDTVLAHPRVEDEGWILDTDASGYALGYQDMPC
jgi:hypothetical protein